MKEGDHRTTAVFTEDLVELSPEPNSTRLYFMQSFQESGAIGDPQFKKLLGAGSMAISNRHVCPNRIVFGFTNLQDGSSWNPVIPSKAFGEKHQVKRHVRGDMQRVFRHRHPENMIGAHQPSEKAAIRSTRAPCFRKRSSANCGRRIGFALCSRWKTEPVANAQQINAPSAINLKNIETMD